ncbi:MAG: LytTR family DNA-binding domain-containing protein [Pseudomonadota bacterium]
MKLSALIVDDEPLARARMTRLLATLKEVDVVATGNNGNEAVDLAIQYHPDIVYLDIRMPECDGILAAKRIKEALTPAPAIVFCTAYDQFALEAIGAQASDYLLKPVSVEMLKESLHKIRQPSKLQAESLELEDSRSRTRLRARGERSLQLESIDRVVYCYSDAKHVYAMLDDGNIRLISSTLKQLLGDYSEHLMQIHRGTVVNKRALKSLYNHPNGSIEIGLNGVEERLKVSKRRAAVVRQVFKDLP